MGTRRKAIAATISSLVIFGTLVASNVALYESQEQGVVLHAVSDQAEAVGRIADALSAALGTDVRVRPSGTGYRAEVDLGSLDAALDLARRLRPRAVA